MVKYYKSIIFLFISVIIISIDSCKLKPSVATIDGGVYIWEKTVFDFSERVITPDSVNKSFHIIIGGHSSNKVEFYEDGILIDQGQWYTYGFRNYESVVISGNNTTQFKKREYYFIKDQNNAFYCTSFPYINPDKSRTCYNYFVKQP